MATIIKALVSVMAPIDDQIFKYWQSYSALLRCNKYTSTYIHTYHTIYYKGLFCTSLYFSFPDACACAILDCCPAKLILFAWHNYISMFVSLSSMVACLVDCCQSMWWNLNTLGGILPWIFGMQRILTLIQLKQRK